MRLLLRFGRYTVFVEFEEPFEPFRSWIDRVSPFLVDDDSDCADAFLAIKRVPSWTDTSVNDSVVFGYKGDDLQSVDIEKMTMRGTIEKVSGRFRGNLELSDDYPGTIDFLFRTCLSLLCETRGDILLHSSASLKDGEAWLFVGDSGAGKTTIALELADGGTPASVDRTLVFKGEDQRYYAATTPFGDRDFSVKESLCAPIGGIVFITQGSDHLVNRVSPLEGVRLLLRQTIAISRERNTVSRVLDAAADLTDEVFVCSMVFAKNEGFWDLLRKEENQWKRTREYSSPAIG